jgi:hypothetical protein
MGFGGMRMVGSAGEGEPQVELNLRTGKGNIALYRAGAAPITSVRSSSSPWWRATVDDPAMIGQVTAEAIEHAARVAAETAGPLAASAARAAELAARHVEAAAQEIAREVESAVDEAFGGPTARRDRPPVPPAPTSPIAPPSTPSAPPGPAAPPNPGAVEPPTPPSAGAGPGPAAEPAPSEDAPRPEPPADPTLSVLEALARGEISVDEAQRRLGQRR